MIDVNEIFQSIQGEGPQVGRIVTFVRLGKCNLRCDFCDTKDAQTQWVSVSDEDLYTSITRFGNKAIVFTGGEPLIQRDDIVPLIMRLRSEGYHVSIETNGTMPLADPTMFDLIIVSPKDINVSAYWTNVPNVVFKYVVNENNIDSVLAYIKDYHIRGAYLMPEGINPMEIMGRSVLIVEKLMRAKVDCYLGLRWHIIMGLR